MMGGWWGGGVGAAAEVLAVNLHAAQRANEQNKLRQSEANKNKCKNKTKM